MGTLTATERGAKYKAQADEHADVREFPGPTVRARTEKAIRFLCIVDAAVDPNSDGHQMKLSQWNPTVIRSKSDVRTSCHPFRKMWLRRWNCGECRRAERAADCRRRRMESRMERGEARRTSAVRE